MTFVHVTMSKCQAFLVENDDEKGLFSGAHLPSITLEAEAGKSLSSRLAWSAERIARQSEAIQRNCISRNRGGGVSVYSGQAWDFIFSSILNLRLLESQQWNPPGGRAHSGVV